MSREGLDEIKKILMKKKKPWSSKGFGKVYNWRSSIPDTWVRFLGPKKFQKASELRVSGHLLNNSREFLHTLTTYKIKTLADDGQVRANTAKKVKLSQISRGIDLLNTNRYIADKIRNIKMRSQNSTPLKKKWKLD